MSVAVALLRRGRARLTRKPCPKSGKGRWPPWTVLALPAFLSSLWTEPRSFGASGLRSSEPGAASGDRIRVGLRGVPGVKASASPVRPLKFKLGERQARRPGRGGAGAGAVDDRVGQGLGLSARGPGPQLEVPVSPCGAAARQQCSLVAPRGVANQSRRPPPPRRTDPCSVASAEASVKAAGPGPS